MLNVTFVDSTEFSEPITFGPFNRISMINDRLKGFSQNDSYVVIAEEVLLCPGIWNIDDVYYNEMTISPFVQG
jgi:hypothetical protein